MTSVPLMKVSVIVVLATCAGCFVSVPCTDFAIDAADGVVVVGVEGVAAEVVRPGVHAFTWFLRSTAAAVCSLVH